MMDRAKALTASVLLTIFATSAGICQDAPVTEPSGDQQGVVVLPFEIRGVTPDEGTQLRQVFAEALAESKRFEVLPGDVMKRMLAEAGLTAIDSCNTLPCLAQLGKVLDAEKVVYATITQQEKRFVLHIRLVESSDASLLYDERVDYEGEFKTLLSDVMPEQGRKLGKAYLDTGTRWYFVAAGILVGIGLIYWIFASWSSSASSDSQSTSPPSASH